MDPTPLWEFLPFGYLFTVAIETPILFTGLSSRHSQRDRILAGFGLTAATYPIVVVVLPLLLGAETPRAAYLLIAETFAPVAECGLFYQAFIRPLPADRPATIRDLVAIVIANLASFLIGEFGHRFVAGSG